MNTKMYKLIVDDLHKKYGDNEVLKGVSLKANAGDVISIIGSSGSGKSTFLRCINFLEQPCSGRIFVNGEEMTARRPARTAHCACRDQKQLQKMRTRLSMVFQHFNLWAHMTVLENIIEAPLNVLGLNRNEAEARARQYLAKVGPSAAPGKAVSVPSVGRSAAAGGDRARAGDGARRHAVRRTHLRARPGAGGRSAESHAGARRRRTHDDRGYPRDGLCPQRVEPRALLDGVRKADL